MKFIYQIYESGLPVNFLNELESVDGNLFVNVYLTRKILKINLENDKIVKTLDFSFLLQSANEIALQVFKNNIQYDECLNGIAYNPNTKQLLITGKNWPVIFDIEFEDPIFEGKIRK